MVTAFRQVPTGTPFISGFDEPAGGWDVGAFVWTGTDNDIVSSDAEIYAAINRSKPAGFVVWTAIQD